MRLDSHQHFWAYDEAEYPWIPRGTPLHRDWLPEDLHKLQQPLGLDGSIAVQARQTVEDSRWLLTLADHDPRIKGVVGWVDLRSPEVAKDLAELSKHPRFRGVRHVVQSEPDNDFMIRPEFLRGIGELAGFGLTYDILIFPKQLPAAIELVSKHPKQPFVLDHIAKPLIKDKLVEPWRTQLRELAQAPNLTCKVSGIVTEADQKNWKAEEIRPYLDIVFEAFGPDRLMWGSDWPVCLLAGSYESVFRLVDEYASGLTPAQHEGLLGGNCSRFYGLK
ncbi:MAG TPA: amidohydrolase family protein [Chthoniobacteraceae bacterium]|jgi:L-fuconolactonase|nr:amidohydrolase family protein [Chthoniobacteraceae bacterium]